MTKRLRINFLVHDHAQDALRLCQSVLERGHFVMAVFFDQNAVDLSPLEIQTWCETAMAQKFSLQMCHSALEARKLEVPAGFERSGLGSFFEATLQSDRTLECR